MTLPPPPRSHPDFNLSPLTSNHQKRRTEKEQNNIVGVVECNWILSFDISEHYFEQCCGAKKNYKKKFIK
jgi:hypothetical protein